jgi:ubiquinone biosynthesis monooxygenase Coq6
MSKVREFGEIGSAGMDYNQHGLVATVEVEESDNNTAWQIFLPSGPVALLPLSRNRSSVVWSMNSQLLDRVSKMPNHFFVEFLNAAFHNPYQDVAYLFSQIQPNGEVSMEFEKEAAWGRTRDSQGIHPPWVLDVVNDSRAGFPLRMRHADTYAVDRVALLGDAAHTIHPLAGQGLNLGLADSESLSRFISDAQRDGQDIGSTVLT